jgi:hypothetical protein
LQGKSQDAIYAEQDRRVNEELSGKHVLTVYNQRSWRIDYVDYSTNIKKQTTTQKNGKTITLQDYYKQVSFFFSCFCVSDSVAPSPSHWLSLLVSFILCF